MTKKLNSVFLKWLFEIADEPHDESGPNGETITKMEAFARLHWDKALGYKETIEEVNKRGEVVTQTYTRRPETWAIQELANRLAGKVAPAPEKAISTAPTAAEKVGELVKTKLNQLADGE